MRSPPLLALLASMLVGLSALGACSPAEDDTGSGGASSQSATSSGASTGGASSSNTTSSASSGSGGAASSYNCSNPHPAWLLCDDFEGMASGFDAWRANWRWTDHIGADDAGRMTSSTEAHSGGFSLYMPADASAGYQGADLIFRTCAGQNQPGCTLAGYDQLYLRAYLKFAADHQKVHHFLDIGGSQNYWDAFGNAGCRPSGSRHMGTTVDFEEGSHNTFFYTYFPAMTCDSGTSCANYADPQAICDGCAQKGMPCSNGLECCWGNLFRPSPDVPLPLDQWVCFEMMMKPNTVGQANGEMAYWINGALAHEVKTMDFRNDDQLKLNMVRLQHYITTGDAGGHSNRIWFDDVVVSPLRVGCM